MVSPRKDSPIERAADVLRTMSLSAFNGDLLGSETEIVAKLDVSRVTVRQAARLLEQEGILIVRRGKNGGYFSARPSLDLIENVVCTYLETLEISSSHTGSVATALWVEALREAALADRAKAKSVAASLVAMIENLGVTPTMQEISEAEHSIRSAVFELIDGAYMKTIFQINAAYARRLISNAVHTGAGLPHQDFVRKWKVAKLMQCEALTSGDVLQAVLAGIQDRNVWGQHGLGVQPLLGGPLAQPGL